LLKPSKRPTESSFTNIPMDTDMAQKLELMKYSPKKFDAAKGGRAGYSKGGLAKILEL
jgi:hypothetical protein